MEKIKKINIVILDDEVEILSLCERLFQSQPFAVLATTDYEEALRAIDTEDIKVVLSDNRMPHITGVEFLRLVKEKNSKAIRILFTGHADIQVAEDAINKGEVYRLLNKPLDLKELLLLVTEAIEKYDLIKKNNDLTENIHKRNEELEVLSVKMKHGYEAQKQFTSTVSHELRTPLASIKSSIDILNTEAPGKLTDDQKMFIKRVKTNIDRLSRLINDVLDLSKLESGKMVMNLAPVCLEEQIREVIDMQVSAVQEKGLKLEMEIAQDLPFVMADKDRLMQVFSNLVSNALKFTQEGGITITAKCEDEMNVTCCIRDTGVGITEEDLPKLFAKFKQVGSVSQQVAGTGLGLAICKEIMTAHNGQIWVGSEFGKGSQFYFTLPLKTLKRIMIVDDDQGTIKILKNILSSVGDYEIETAADGFLAGQKSHTFKPQLIILDINMPQINGLDICRGMKDDPEMSGIKIMMHSSFDSEQDEKNVWDAGADEILKKPANSADVIAKVAKLLS